MQMFCANCYENRCFKKEYLSKKEYLHIRLAMHALLEIFEIEKKYISSKTEFYIEKYLIQ